ncbi:uncharacterized protein CTHT_0051960 [Thermochaetoides thermophila DSM 1495]|uniref:MICOS complex subunit MIC12 n=1 Tax=Chaetomium thermophilum (strain DSM 1495 / CBS 144.50 / IMI 039719) TaxID=759272 RepID=G0SDJ0_CHATD|nr:hypothetical protein CTHT_0051960 [Thermochaetoides thermophila DSM 1495]EGS18591.1 hypothetical protein CTHT_0051960 [Thermochaetoides thermophila DSM 1495]
MGFLAGFAGGATITLAATYLALHTHSQNRLAQATILRSQAATLDSLVPPTDEFELRRRHNASVILPDGTYLPRRSLLYSSPDDATAVLESLRPRGPTQGPISKLVESAKERWNAELQGALRWAMETDWQGVREHLEENVARIMGWEVPKTVVEEVVVVRRPQQPPQRVQEVEWEERNHEPGLTVQAAALASAKTRAALHDARERAGQAVKEAERAVVEEAREVRDKMVREIRRDVKVVQEELRHAKEKASGLIHEARERVQIAEDKAEEKLEHKVVEKVLEMTDVQRALAERFDSRLREERMNRSVEEVLRERYAPIGQRDNGRLRGL